MLERLVINILETAINLPSRFIRTNNTPTEQGFYLGTTKHPYNPNKIFNVYLTYKELATHLYIAGASGSGKTKTMEFLMRQLFSSKFGLCLCDPHGDLVQNLLHYLGSLVTSPDSKLTIEEIKDRLILIEPFNPDCSIGFNPLESSNNTRYSLILELMSIFKKLWKDSNWGPRMDELLRNAFLTLSANGMTILEVKRLLTDSEFRHKMLENVDLSEVKEYWQHRYDKLSEKMQAVYREPVLNRISIFTTNPHIRYMIGQSKSTFNFRDAMDHGKWVLINLSKGYLMENSYLLGGLFIAKLQNSAMSRVDIPEKQRKPFYLFVDEFQNFLGGLNDLEAVLSESRKYKLILAMAHQNMAQVDTELRSSILGNVGTKILYRLSHRDASYLSSELSQREKGLIERRLIDLKVGQAYLKKKSEPPVILKTAHVPDVTPDPRAIELIKNASFSTYARSWADVQKEIDQRSEGYDDFDAAPDRNVSKSSQGPVTELEEGLDGW